VILRINLSRVPARQVVGLVADVELLAGFADGLRLTQQNVGFPKLVNDFFGMVQISSGGGLPLLIWTQNFRLGQYR